MAAAVAVAGFTLVRTDEAVLGPAPTSLNTGPFLTTSSPPAGEDFGLIAAAASTVGARGLKIGFA